MKLRLPAVRPIKRESSARASSAKAEFLVMACVMSSTLSALPNTLLHCAARDLSLSILRGPLCCSGSVMTRSTCLPALNTTTSNVSLS